ncbi:MAG TPA: hypothetical protein PL059_10315 [Spirochaetota bacterium]|nr:hypothetical protein [Spirochaetota bacterium]HOJ29456.1 hypothetical protein [Spirochaetota bacterium]HOM10605.1 hypothetical protein [Spirochaetota bacterium]HPP50381.1 hypothetical protein [Spirochaetota bacterium]
MKKYSLLFLSLCVIVSLISCGSSTGKYSDVRALMQDSITAQENLIKDIDAANNAGDVAKAINSYADAIETLQPKIKKLQAKYPELNNENAQLPKELLDLEQKQAEISQKLTTSMMEKMPKYATDKEVMKASMRLAKISQM